MSVMYAVYPTVRGNILDGALPTKMFDAANFGRPSLVNSGCLMGDIAESEQIGIAIDPMNQNELISKLLVINEKCPSPKLERVWSGESKRLVAAYNSLGNLS